MSHVDDGELTAYADGAYPANDPVALRIGEHLSTCDNCRTRLEQNEILRGRASEILAFATPLNVETPAFEELQAQAGTTVRKPRFAIPLTWAASIMLAIGLGWFGRGAWNENPALEPIATRAVVNESSPDALTGPAETTTAPVVVEETRMAAPTLGRRATGTAGAGANANAPVSDMAAVAAAPPPPPPPSVAPAPAPQLADQKLELAEIVVTGEARQLTSESIDMQEAERRGLTVPRIEGLPVRRVVLYANGGMRVEQTLPDQKSITLDVAAPPVAQFSELRAREDAARKMRAEGAAAPQRAAGSKAIEVPSVTVMRGANSITVQANLTVDSLRALAEKITGVQSPPR